MKAREWYMVASSIALAGAIAHALKYQAQLHHATLRIHNSDDQIIGSHINELIQEQSLGDVVQSLIQSLYSAPSLILSSTYQSWMQTLAVFIRSRISFLVALNFMLATLLVVSQTFVERVFGSLSDHEKKSCRDSACRFALFRCIMIAALVPIDMRDISVWLSFFAIMGVLHCCYVITRERFSTITVLPSATAQVFYQMIAVLCVLLLIHFITGICTIALFYHDATISVICLLLYENVVASLMCMKMIGKYSIHVRDLELAAWEERQAALVRCEFIFEATAHFITVVHYIHVWSFYGLSVTFVDLVLFLHLRSAALTFFDRCSKYFHYRRATAEINNRYPDATPEELRDADDTCAICREPLEQAKKLACNHFFHRNCLLTWLEYKSICPSCRAPLFNSSSWSQPAAVQPTAAAGATTDAVRAAANDPPAATGAAVADDNLEATMALIRRLQMEDAVSAGPLGALMTDERPGRADAAPLQARSLFQFDTRNISSFLPSFRFAVVSSSHRPVQQTNIVPEPLPVAADDVEPVVVVSNSQQHVEPVIGPDPHISSAYQNNE